MERLTVAFNVDVNSDLFVVPARVPGLTYSLATRWVSKDVSPSPYLYDLVDQRRGGLPEIPPTTPGRRT